MPVDARDPEREAAIYAMVAAVPAGVLAGLEPKLAAAAVAGAALVALAFAAPVAHLCLLLAVTAIVPYELQSAVSFGGGGTASPGLFPSDVLLAGGLVRATLVLLDAPLARLPRRVLPALAAVLVIAVLQAIHGVRAGAEAGVAGSELRVLAGFGAAIVALPIVLDRSARGRLLAGLLVLGAAIGLWGIAQWTIDIPFSAAQDAGVRAGVRFTTSGRGQIQGGLFAFPVVIVMGVAALLSPAVRRPGARVLLVLVVALNALDLLLTYERTFWATTMLALALVALRAPRRERVRALVAGPVMLALVVAALAAVAPGDVAAARERLLSIGQYGTDLSIRYRVVETRTVQRAIEAHPATGSGLGATILWGRAYENVPPTTEAFSHNGYTWLAWKLGIPAAIGLVCLFVGAIVVRGPPGGAPLQTGAQASLALLLISSLTFPAFNTLGITAVMGALLAFCFAGRQAA